MGICSDAVGGGDYVIRILRDAAQLARVSPFVLRPVEFVIAADMSEAILARMTSDDVKRGVRDSLAS